MAETGLHILVVDDDTLARMTAMQCAKRLGHAASAANGGDQALSMLRSSRFDLILLDLLMPEVDGFQVLRQLSGESDLREIPVIMVTGADEANSIAKCMELGARGHLSKPLDSQQLTAQIDAILGHRC